MSNSSTAALRNLFGEIERLETENTELRRRLKMDELTGIFNRTAMEDHIRHTPGGWFVFADMDGLGAVNKEQGHDKADLYIKEFSWWLRRHTRQIRAEIPCDAICNREGGDEFLVWCSDEEGAQRVRDRIREWTSIDGKMTCSAGMAKERGGADRAMSESKRERKKVNA